MDETTFVLFGSTGDLAKRKILPSLCKLFTEGEHFRIIACGRDPLSNKEYCSLITPALASFSSEEREPFLSHITYKKGDLGDGSFYEDLRKEILSEKILYHLSLPPVLYTQVLENLGRAGLTGKLLLEKPFGEDVASATFLEETIEKYFAREDIFRVDHYFGKTGLWELLEYRKTHPEFESLIETGQLASVTCRILEALDIQGRGAFYDAVGALRDVGQNHLLLMLGTALMDTKEPVTLARARVLETLSTPAEKLVRGQYEGYTHEEGVQEHSSTETYFKIITESSAPRLASLRIILEAGKALRAKKTDITFSFKDGTEKTFDIEQVSTHYDYAPLIRAALSGDGSFFSSIEEVLASWTFIDAVSKQFLNTPLEIYKKGKE